MSTLPFLLSVADELDNINSQSYMDDFGLGFHPHRQYYRTPTIQLSLPASTDWMEDRHSRYRSHRYYSDTTQNNLYEKKEEDDDDDADEEVQQQRHYDDANIIASLKRGESETKTTKQRRNDAAADAVENNLGASTSSAAAAAAAAAATSAGSTQKYAAALIASNLNLQHKNTCGSISLRGKSPSGTARLDQPTGGGADDDSIDNTVRMYNLSKKCCKNYYRHALETGPGAGKGAVKCTAESTANSSSEESLQKVSSPIEFLTCFLVKKSRASKNVASKKS